MESVRAEGLGYDRIGIWDSPALFREPWAVLGAVAVATHSARIGPWVTNPQTRHPLITASAAATIDDLAPGRVYIGIGSGGTGVWHTGNQASPLAELEAYVVTIRCLLEDGEAEYGGSRVILPWARRQIPIIMAAHGPKSIRLAGRIADGVVIGLGVTPDVIEGSLELLAAGAREAGRDPDAIEVWFTCFWFVDPVPGAARREASWAATAFAAHFARTGVDGKFVPKEYQAGIMELGRRYDYVSHGAVPEEQKAEYTRLAHELGIGEYLQRRFVFAGTPDEVQAQIQGAVAAGAKRFDGAIDADLPEHEERIVKWARLVLPRFRN
jgi:5,10-methylenetetrahydromethanopterin reductase